MAGRRRGREGVERASVKRARRRAVAPAAALRALRRSRSFQCEPMSGCRSPHGVKGQPAGCTKHPSPLQSPVGALAAPCRCTSIAKGGHIEQVAPGRATSSAAARAACAAAATTLNARSGCAVHFCPTATAIYIVCRHQQSPRSLPALAHLPFSQPAAPFAQGVSARKRSAASNGGPGAAAAFGLGRGTAAAACRRRRRSAAAACRRQCGRAAAAARLHRAV